MFSLLGAAAVDRKNIASQRTRLSRDVRRTVEENKKTVKKTIRPENKF